MTTEEFFEQVKKGEISEFHTYSKVQDMTDNFNETKLTLFCKDFDMYLIHYRQDYLGYITDDQDWLGCFSDHEGDEKTQDYIENNRELPELSDIDSKPTYVFEFFKTNKKLKYKRPKSVSQEHKKDIDWFVQDIKDMKDSAINGIELAYLYKLRDLLVSLVKKHTNAVYRFDDKKPQVNTIQPIHWLKGDKSLKKLIEELKKANLIENRETKEIIEEHFKQTNKKPKPIHWHKSNRLLNYLFKKLSKADIIDTMDRKFKLITEHFLDKKGEPLKRNSLKQDYQNMKISGDPRGAKMVDTIIKKFTT